MTVAIAGRRLGAARRRAREPAAPARRRPRCAGPGGRSPLLPGRAAIVDALLGTGFAGRAARGGRRGDRRDQRRRGARRQRGRAQRRRRLHRRRRRRGGARGHHRHLPRRQARLWISPGKAHAGAVCVDRHRHPPRRSRRGRADRTVGLIGPAVLDGLPRRGAASTKFSSGHVLVAGGSRGLTGAPRMAALAAMRAGAGYVTACVPASLQAILASGGPPELMTRGLPDEDGGLTARGRATTCSRPRGGAARSRSARASGATHGAFAFARELARRAPVPMVLDADGLNAHAGRLRRAGRRGRRRPCSPPTPASSGGCCELPARRSSASACATSAHAARGSRGRWWCSRATTRWSPTRRPRRGQPRRTAPRSRRPAPATCSTGVIARAARAGRSTAFTAAAAGVWLHAEAGRRAAQALGGVAEGVIASDVIAALPGARTGGPR